VLAPTLRADREPGRSVPLLPAADLPASAAWAVGSPTIADAMARAYATLELAGARSVPASVRELVQRRVADWRGEETGLSRQWCEDLVAELPAEDRGAGRLALLTAFASYQVDEEVITEFRRDRSASGAGSDDAALVDTAAWAAFVASRQVGLWHLPAIGHATRR
jgi:hypothetical protein